MTSILPVSTGPTSSDSPPAPPPPPSDLLSPSSSSQTDQTADAPATSTPSTPAAPPPQTQSPPPPPSPSPPTQTPPPAAAQSAPPPPAKNSPPSPTLHAPPPSVPSSATPPAITPPAPSTNSSTSNGPASSPLPTVPTEKPTAKPTNGTSSNNTSTNSEGVSSGGVVAIGSIAGVIVLSLLVLAVFIAKKRRRRSGPKLRYNMPSPFASSQNSESAFIPYPPAPLKTNGIGSDSMYSPNSDSSNSRQWFTYKDLERATDGFSKQNVLGEGGFGCVYKGILTDGRVVAVKQLKKGSGQGEREFKAEVEIISRVHHRHLVSLVGYCISEDHRLLVYAFVSNDTLDHHLHALGRPVMEWSTRVRVAAGSARGIAYLHEDCHPRIIHRDIKSSNILLDDHFEAQVADFGLAKSALDTNTHISTRVMGTFGYMAPEYAQSGKLTDKSDVYSFGVVLLELITGRKPVDDTQPLGDESLVEWARPLLTEALENEDFTQLIDPRLENNYVDIELFRMIEAAAACVRHSATKRPKMSQVVRALDSLDELSDISNGVKPGQSGVFDSRQHSAQIKMFQRMAFGGSQDYSSDVYSRSNTQNSWGRDSGERSRYIP
ncbi:hypothetical protein ACFE04_010197 [Oxalis oulophora]